MIKTPGPIASRALVRLLAEPGQAIRERARELEASLIQKDFSKGNFSALAKERLLASTTLLKETYVEGPALAHWAAANQFIVEKISTGLSLNAELIRSTHKILLPESGGKLRTTFVQGGNSQYPEVESLPLLWDQFQERLSVKDESPLLRAAVIYQWLVTLHFFEDANGRLGRLCADGVLLTAGLPPLSFSNDAMAFVSALAEPDFFTVDDAIIRVCEGVTHSMKILQE